MLFKKAYQLGYNITNVHHHPWNKMKITLFIIFSFSVTDI